MSINGLNAAVYRGEKSVAGEKKWQSIAYAEFNPAKSFLPPDKQEDFLSHLVVSSIIFFGILTCTLVYSIMVTVHKPDFLITAN
jgi:hypothetical protein